MRFILLLIILFPLYAIAQKFSVDRPDEKVKPDPYTTFYFADLDDHSNVVSIITTRKERSTNFRLDTLDIWYYEKGLKVRSINFSGGKRSTTTFYNYNAVNDLDYWLTIEKYESILTKYKYNKVGQLIETHQYSLTKKDKKTDTSERSRMLFRYDKAKLVQITNNALGADIIEAYHYKNDQLQSKTGGFLSKQFIYGNNGRVEEYKEFMGGSIDSTKYMGRQKMVYDNEGRVILDSVLTSNNIPSSTYMVTQYTYDSKNTITSMLGRYKDLYSDANFICENGRIKTITMKTNGYSAYLRFFISHRIQEYYSFPIQYSEAYTYDSHGNRTSKKIFVNDELFTHVEYHITYRN